MADLRAYQPSFTAGELSPALWARVDLAKYGSGLKTALNLFIHPHGGISNRAGFEFIREVKDSSDHARLIPFQFNTEQSYILEFGDKYIRVFKDGGLVTSGGLPYEVVTPYESDDVGSLVFIQEADVMYICHPDHPVQKLSRLADDDWKIEAVNFAPKMEAPTGLSGTAYYSGGNGDSSNLEYRVTSVAAGGEESAGSSSVSARYRFENPAGRFIFITWNHMPGASLYRIYKTDGEGNEGMVGETEENEFETSTVDGDSLNFVPGSSQPGAPPVPTGVSAVVKRGKDISYVVSAINEDTGEESLPSSSVTLENDLSYRGNKNRLSWSAVPGASAYIIYKSENGKYGYIGRSENTFFTDENIAADLSDGPQSARNPFDGPGKYPRCATFIEQRLGFFSTKDDPQAAWLSQSANYENFGVSEPAKASDAVTFRIKARQVNEIRSAIAVKGLMLLTSGAEWVVSGGTQSDAITPSAIKIDNQGYRGASHVQPIVVGNTVLFAQERGGIVRDFSYEFAEDGFTGKDLTIMARHLFEGREIRNWGYCQAPHSVVWVVLDDGSLVSLTYMKEHDVWGWTRHASGAGAFFEDVSVIGEGGEDVPYFIVRRDIDGTSKRYIERLHTRVMNDIEDAFFVDSGLTYEGAAATVISGLDHLEGEQVVALSNGNVVRNLTVSGGEVTLPHSATKVHIGLPYEAALQTLDIDLGMVRELGTVQGRQKSVSKVTLRVERTRGIWVGGKDGTRESGNLVEYRQRSIEAWNEAIQLYTGDLDITTMWNWSRGANVWIKQFDPLPMTILAVMPEVTVGR